MTSQLATSCLALRMRLDGPQFAFRSVIAILVVNKAFTLTENFADCSAFEIDLAGVPPYHGRLQAGCLPRMIGQTISHYRVEAGRRRDGVLPSLSSVLSTSKLSPRLTCQPQRWEPPPNLLAKPSPTTASSKGSAAGGWVSSTRPRM